MKNLTSPLPVMALVILLAIQASFTQAQPGIVWPKGPLMTNARITPAGKLEITASATSSPHDFDFLAGKWTMHNTKLKKRLSNDHEWSEFESTDVNSGPILNGICNTDLYKTTSPDGKPYEGLTVRIFNPKTRLWSIYWVASDVGAMDPPVVGSFEGNIGKFVCKDVYQGKPILMLFVWDKTDKDNPVWSQAFSPDNGVTWEWNFTNVSHRVK